jgi:outer membrane protein assembly factor BamB
LNGAVYLTQPNGQIWRVEPASNSSATTPEANIISPIATETIEVGGDNLRGTETPGIAPDPTKDVTAEATQTPLILLPTTTPESNVVIPNATETPASTPSSQQETPVPTETPMSEPIVEVNQGGNTGRSWYREEIEPTDQVEVVSPIATNFQPFGATAVGELLVMVGVANDSQTPGVALVNPDTGEHLWFAEDMFAPAIAADDEHVYARQYVQSSDPEGAPTQVIVALSIHTGEVVWSHELVGHVGTDDPSKAGPVLSGGVVYMPDTMGRINAYDAETGEVVWEQPEALVELSPDAVSTGGRLVFTDTGMYLTAGINTIAKIDAATGEVEAMEILSAPDEPAFSSIELLSNGYDLVAIGTIQKQVGGTTDFEHYSVLMTVDKLRLEPLWSISFTQLLMGNVVAAPNVLLAPVIREDGTKGIVRINPTTGDPLHEDILLPESAERISLSVAGEAIYSVDTDGMLRMYSLASGEMRHEASIGEPFPGAPPIPITFTPGQAVAVNEDGTVYLITWR